MCKILHIGLEPEEDCVMFHPLVFIYVEHKRFVEELFCRALWLLARTRREMLAKTRQDHDKVLEVLHCQLQLALLSKPKKYKSLTECIKIITYEHVSLKWEVGLTCFYKLS